MSEPRCSLCGARSKWLFFSGMPGRLHQTIPAECNFCRQEDHVHWQQWVDGIDVTEFGGKPFRNPRPTEEWGM